MSVSSLKVSANDLATQVFSVEENWIHAIERCDISALNTLAGDEFTMVCEDGTVIQRDRAILDGYLCNTGTSRISIDSLDIRLYGKTAVVLGRRILQYTGNERTQLRFMNVMIQRDHRWQIVAEELTDIS
jgi:hypothetical protein